MTVCVCVRVSRTVITVCVSFNQWFSDFFCLPTEEEKNFHAPRDHLFLFHIKFYLVVRVADGADV